MTDNMNIDKNVSVAKSNVESVMSVKVTDVVTEVDEKLITEAVKSDDEEVAEVAVVEVEEEAVVESEVVEEAVVESEVVVESDDETVPNNDNLVIATEFEYEDIDFDVEDLRLVKDLIEKCASKGCFELVDFKDIGLLMENVKCPMRN